MASYIFCCALDATCTQYSTQNQCSQTFMPRVGFESTILTFERGKTLHALEVFAYRYDLSVNLLQIQFSCHKLIALQQSVNYMLYFVKSI
jgi:hypothetical protein